MNGPMNGQPIVSQYGNHRVEMDEEQLDKLLASLRQPDVPQEKKDAELLSYVAYQAGYWLTLLNKMIASLTTNPTTKED